MTNVFNTVAANQRLALRTVVWQLVATGVVALALLAVGGRWSLAALFGGLAVVAGSGAATWLALGGGVASAGTALVRLLAGVVLKWLLVLAVVAVALAGLRLPGLAVLAGLAAAMLALVLANVFKPRA